MRKTGRFKEMKNDDTGLAVLLTGIALAEPAIMVIPMPRIFLNRGTL